MGGEVLHGLAGFSGEKGGYVVRDSVRSDPILMELSVPAWERYRHFVWSPQLPALNRKGLRGEEEDRLEKP